MEKENRIIKNLVRFDDTQKNQFFKEKRDTLEKFLEIIIRTDLSDIYVYCSLLGAFYELFLKVCILKENWGHIKDYKENKNMNFEYAKTKIIELLKNKNLGEKQIEKIKNVLNFVQIQSNNFCTTLFKELDHNIIKFQIYESIAVLDDIFEINLNDDLLNEMLDQVFVYKKRENIKMNFEEGFEDKIKEIYLNYKFKEKTPSEIIEEKLIYNPSYRIQLDDGEFYPKEIKPVEIGEIPPAEPHVLITDLYLYPEEWYSMDTLIEAFAEEAFLSYKKEGYYLASISCSINCCEYTLKYEFLRRSPREYAKELIENKRKKGEPQFGLGFFTGDNNKNLKELGIDTKFSEKLNYLNSIRICLYHFNPRKIENIQKKGKTFMEKIGNPITDEEVIRTAYKVYNIMKELVEHFYNNDETIKKEVEEALKDYNKKKKIVIQEVHRQFGLPKEFIEGYLEKRSKFIEKEYLKSKKGVNK